MQEALEQAVAWLIEQRDLHNAYEATERPVNGGLELVHIRHFTAAWVVKALVSAGVPTAHPSVSNAVAQIWSSYGGDTAALWALGQRRPADLDDLRRDRGAEARQPGRPGPARLVPAV